jgi:hypothetical protein
MFDFPASPSDGQAFSPAGGPTWVYNAVRGAWGAVGANNTGVIVSDTPPPNPFVGMLWHESDTGSTFVWVDDGNSTQWVQFNIAPLPTFPPSDGGEYVMVNGVWRLKSQSFNLDGLSQLDIQIPTTARLARLALSARLSATGQIYMRWSGDGTTFVAGASDYIYGGAIHNSGSAAYGGQATVSGGAVVLTPYSDNLAFITTAPRSSR